MAVTSAAACESGNQRPEGMSFNFAKNSATLKSEDVLRFAEWSIYLREKYPLQWASVVNGIAAPYEQNPRELATRRAATIVQWAVKFGLARRRIEASIELPKDISGWGDTPQAGGIDFIPGCPNDCCVDITRPIQKDGEPPGLPRMTR
jgi:hypothetical protein